MHIEISLSSHNRKSGEICKDLTKIEICSWNHRNVVLEVHNLSSFLGNGLFIYRDQDHVFINSVTK